MQSVFNDTLISCRGLNTERVQPNGADTVTQCLHSDMGMAAEYDTQCGPVVLAFCVCLNDLIFSKQRATTVGPSHTVIVRHGLPSTRFLRGCGSCMLEVWVTSWSVGELATSKVGL